MAVRRLRIRRCYSPGLDGNLHLRCESLCVGFAYPNGNSNTNCDCHGHSDAYCYGYTYTYAETDAHAEISAYTKASPNAAASAVTLADSR